MALRPTGFFSGLSVYIDTEAGAGAEARTLAGDRATGPRTRPSTKRRRGVGTPEIWFKIVHVTLDEVDPAAYRDQTVEVTLGPWGAFENGSVGLLKRRVPASQVVTAIPERQRRPKPPKPPRVVETLLKAMEWRRQIDAGEVPDQATIARREGVSRARVTQVLMLLRLAPDIQESILALPGSPNPPRLPERVLRPIALLDDSEEQTAAFEEVTRRHP